MPPKLYTTDQSAGKQIKHPQRSHDGVAQAPSCIAVNAAFPRLVVRKCLGKVSAAILSKTIPATNCRGCVPTPRKQLLHALSATPLPFLFLLQLVGARTPLPRVQSAFGSQAHCLRAASHEYTVVGLDRQKATTTRLTRHLATKKDERSAAEQHHLASAGLQKPDEPPTTHHAPLLSRYRDLHRAQRIVFPMAHVSVNCHRRVLG